MKKSEKNQPVKKVRSGRITVTLWERKVTREDGETVEFQRACVQHSRKNKDSDEWNNQQIWLNVEELRNMAEALDELNEEGEKSPSSVRAHCIVEYIKTNSIDAGLDIFDLQERSVQEILHEYGINVKIKPWEEKIVADELKELIENREFAEMARMVHNGNIDIRYPDGFHTSHPYIRNMVKTSQ